jgi:hypothetical protein
MPNTADYQPGWGTALATFTQTGTFSAVVAVNGRLSAVYSDNYPAAAGSIVWRASASPSGTGWPIQTGDGTALKTLAFGSGTYYSFNNLNAPIPITPYVVLQIGTAGTSAAVTGGTIVLVTEA